MSILDSLKTPVIVAPMAGGPSTPALVNAAAEAGSLGFLAGGVMPVEQLKQELAEVKGVFGVNLFRPQSDTPKPSDIDELAGLLSSPFRQYGLNEPTVPTPDLTNGWEEKFAAVLGAKPAVFSCTFGIFSSEEFAQIKDAGIEAWVTVTNPEDAVTAQKAGADALVVQGPEAGGHRSTWTIGEEPDERDLATLIQAVKQAGVEIPLIAAGGLSTASDVAAILDKGASAASCGSAFLLSPEAGTSALNREILDAAPALGLESVSSRAFSGRFARGVETQFTRSNEGLPPLYPYLNPMITSLRKAAGSAGNWDYAYCLVGVGLESIAKTSAKQILESLTPSALS
ncbi:oxidoreductase [Corynebacterium suranareeae]|uniref:Propionate 3-nitronate monooxygenase n=1 Tax=Corynebacterium suranareeae TaxID=2506452 RepID=A0A161JNI8_9CORY|nr:nitronate monooxygenase family protein [Corynebacterium suranareeae]BAU95318.1 oxidoreductase [Corynebacterium suranareeae]